LNNFDPSINIHFFVIFANQWNLLLVYFWVLQKLPSLKVWYSPKRSDLRLLTIPASWARVAELNPYWDAIYSFAPDYSFASFCAHHCSTCVALPIRAMRTWRHPHLPSTFSRLSIMHREWHNTRVALVNELNLTSHDTSWRQPCSTCFRILLKNISAFHSRNVKGR